jgi:hypothetical protein
MRIRPSPALIVLAALALAIAAHATPLNRRQLVKTYKEAKETKLDACVTCHVGTGTELNRYGNDLHVAKAKFADVEKLDSDRDGFTNLDEIKALTFPGDSTDTPRRRGKADSTAARSAVLDSAASVASYDTLRVSPRDSTDKVRF